MGSVSLLDFVWSFNLLHMFSIHWCYINISVNFISWQKNIGILSRTLLFKRYCSL
jgi:hypothetical protein